MSPTVPTAPVCVSIQGSEVELAAAGKRFRMSPYGARLLAGWLTWTADLLDPPPPFPDETE